MSIQEIQDYCQSLPNTEKAMPCGENLLVFHMEGNIYLYVWLNPNRSLEKVSCHFLMTAIRKTALYMLDL